MANNPHFCQHWAMDQETPGVAHRFHTESHQAGWGGPLQRGFRKKVGGGWGGVGWGNKVQTCCVHVMQNMGVKGNHPHVLHNFTSRVPNTTDGPQQNWWNGWSTVACWVTPHDKFLLLRAMSLQNDAWYVPSKVSSFCSSKLQQNKNLVKHRRFEKHVRAKLPARRVL